MIVLKFGGKSLGDNKKIERIARYIKKRTKEEKLVVVVSAIADTTDRLLALAESFNKKTEPRELDALLSCGEAVSASLVAMKLCSIGVKACSMLGWQAGIFAEGDFGSGAICAVDVAKIEKKLETFDCVVVTGFQAVNEDGDIITLGRGGSDTSAVALGAALDAKVEIYSDFDGIFAGDPRRGNFKKYREVDYSCAFSYAETGAKVLSKSSTQVAMEAKVDLTCKSSEKPNLSGTKIINVPTPFVGINVKKDLCQIDIVTNKPENKRKTVKYILENINYHDLSINKDKISILLDQCDLEAVEQNISKLNNLLKEL